MRNWLQNFMVGRNGFDRLCLVQALGALALDTLGRLTGWEFLTFLGTGMLVWMLYRALSRNLARRQAENQQMLSLRSRTRSDVQAWHARRQQRREFRFFRCPGCRNWLRVPRGKGKIQITCPRCGHRFSDRT